MKLPSSVLLGLAIQTQQEQASLKATLQNITHDMNNAMSVICLETGSLINEGLQRKIIKMNELIRSLQNTVLTNDVGNHHLSCECSSLLLFLLRNMTETK